jgi:pyruvate,orthophosphate dikinase
MNFLPHSEKEILEVANVVGVDLKEVKSRISELHEQTQCLVIEVAG